LGGWGARLDENALILGGNPWAGADPLGGAPGAAA